MALLPEREDRTDPRIGWPDGHFYSPVPSAGDIKRALESADHVEREILGIPIDQEAMVKLGSKLSDAFGNFMMEPRPIERHLYGYEQSTEFNLSDAITLTAFLASLVPRRVIEIGSGFSTAVMLDARAAFSLEFHLTSVDPNPERLWGILGRHKPACLSILEEQVQDVALETFNTLQPNDLLFIDSSHVCKAGSDVLYEFFEIIPRLSAGVIIHIHDIFHNFEYPSEWLNEGRYWSEAYLLRALLTNNSRLEILFWQNGMEPTKFDELNDAFPQLMRQVGSSMYLRTT